jgi:hypothetical protein
MVFREISTPCRSNIFSCRCSGKWSAVLARRGPFAWFKRRWKYPARPPASLTVGGQAAVVNYCGAAATEIIDQLNFTCPSGVSASEPYVDAVLTIGGARGRFRVPAPAQ